MKHIFLALAILSAVFISFNSIAQNTTTSIPGAQPDFPGTLMVDIGTNFLLDAPEDMSTKIFASRGVNVYYMYEYQLGESRFTFLPGIGFGFVKFEFENDITLSDISAGDTLELIELDDAIYDEVKKSQLAVNYLDIPLELRFTTNKDIQGKGFMVAVGGKVGLKLDSYTRLKYDQDDETKKSKLKQDFNLNAFRYGVHARVGWRAIHLYGYYAFSPLFDKGKGPQETDPTHVKVGLSIALF